MATPPEPRDIDYEVAMQRVRRFKWTRAATLPVGICLAAQGPDLLPPYDPRNPPRPPNAWPDKSPPGTIGGRLIPFQDP